MTVTDPSPAGTDPGAPPPAGTPPAAPPAPAGSGGPTFTQADLDAIAGRTRAEARQAAEKEILQALGVDNVDAARAAVEAARAAEDAQKTEVQRLTDERDRLAKEAEEARASANATFAMTRVEGALRDAGIKPDRIPAALRLADLGGITVTGTEVSGITEAVESVKQASPEWFGPTVPSAPDASGGRPGDVDYRHDPEAARRVLRDQYHIKS